MDDREYVAAALRDIGKIQVTWRFDEAQADVIQRGWGDGKRFIDSLWRVLAEANQAQARITELEAELAVAKGAIDISLESFWYYFLIPESLGAISDEERKECLSEVAKSRLHNIHDQFCHYNPREHKWECKPQCSQARQEMKEKKDEQP